MSEHTPGPWHVGFTLATQGTRRWTQEQWDANNERERRMVFARFSAADQGRSRVLIADTTSPGNARRIVAAVNACASIPTEALEARVVADLLAACYAALTYLTTGITGDITDQPIHAQLRDALAKARGSVGQEASNA